MNNMEIRLLRTLVERESYDEVRDIVKSTTFSEDLQDIAAAIIHLHGEFDQGVDMDVVLQHIQTTEVYSTAKRGLMEELINKINAVEPVNDGVCRAFVFDLARKDSRMTALNELARVIEKNEESHEHVITTLSRVSLEDESDNEVVPTGLSDLRDFYATTGKYPFNVPILQTRIGGLSRGNLAIVFGRPEIGKSSFVASLVAGYIKSGIRVEYYANEEPGLKIMLNIRRAVTGEDDAGIRAAILAKNDPTDWPTHAQYLTVRQIGEMQVDTILARAIKHKPEVIILDQVDKLQLMNKTESGHERLRMLYEKTRTLAKTADCLVVNVSQASIDAERRGVLPYSYLADSKTGKAGEADIIIGIGKHGELHPEDEDTHNQVVHLTVSKNKINGWHGNVPVFFDAHTNQWSSGNE